MCRTGPREQVDSPAQSQLVVEKQLLFLAAAEILLRFVLIPFLNSPCYETPKNAIKKWSKTTEGGKKTEGKKNHILCDEPRWIFVKNVLSCF
jgi:hypothetical protein